MAAAAPAPPALQPHASRGQRQCAKAAVGAGLSGRVACHRRTRHMPLPQQPGSTDTCTGFSRHSCCACYNRHDQYHLLQYVYH